MYAWIWRHLPGGTGGKLGGSLALLVAVVAALWFGLFPVVEPHMPFNDGEIDNPGATATAPQVPAGSAPTGAPSSARGTPGGTRSSGRPTSGASGLPGGGVAPSSPHASRSSR